MKQRGILFAVCVAGLTLGLAGCDDSVRRPVQVVPPVNSSTTAKLDLKSLPLDSFRVRAVPPIVPLAPPDGVNRMLAWAEATYQAGLMESKAGHPSHAQRDFEAAIKGLEASGYDASNDPRMAPLYNRILESARAYDLAAAKDTDSSVEPASVPAPIDEIAALEVAPDTALRGLATHELARAPHDLPLVVNDTVLSYLNFFRSTRGRAIVESGLRRAGRYQDMIRRVFHEEGVPQDLIYLAQAESGFQPQALSKAGARGIWQFMAWRGREYGLQKSWWVDDRQDPEKSTRAAARHLRDLYGQFGDWYLAMAAYDCGPGNVSKGIERTGYADFWELYKRNVLPKETKNYVPIILGFMLAAKNAEHFGIEIQPEPPLRADVVRPGSPIDLRLVAESLDVDLDTLRMLNPSLLRMVTPADEEFELRLPAGMGARFDKEIAEAIPRDKWVSWRRYTVGDGETLTQLARKFKLPSQAIAQANSMEPDAGLEAGSKVIIPAAAVRPQTGFGKVVRYRVRKTDTLQSIADEFDVSVVELKKWNGLRGDRVGQGVRLKIYPGGHAAPPAPKESKAPKTAKVASPAPVAPEKAVQTAAAAPVVHKVKQGETLWSIAQAYQTSVEAVRRANRFLSTRQLQVGDQLMIFPPR
jgi:membrane-bound lytic murein transglycosylase D